MLSVSFKVGNSFGSVLSILGEGALLLLIAVLSIEPFACSLLSQLALYLSISHDIMITIKIILQNSFFHTNVHNLGM